MKMTSVVGMVIVALSIAMMVPAFIDIALGFGLIKWPNWFSFSSYLRVAGVLFLLAAITGVCASGGWGRWGRWGFALLFGVAAYHLLYESVPADYPTRHEAFFELTLYTGLFIFGSLHLQAKAIHWLD